MRTFVDIVAAASGAPARLVREIGRIDVGRGREDLYRAQQPQALSRLAAQTRYESISASNAIENVVVAPERALDLVERPATRFRDRAEREFAGYRDAIDYVLARPAEQLTVPLLLHLHRLLMRHVDDPLAGALKTEDNVIGDRTGGGGVRVVFEPVPAGPRTEWHLSELAARYEAALAEGTAHPLVLVCALVLDLLAIHPFRDGNGRVARLVTTQELLRHGYGIARYISLEQRIYTTRNSYYRALRDSQSGWHAGEHDLWPWAGYLLRLLADAYDDFERRMVAEGDSGRTKAEQVRRYVLDQAPTTFRSAQVRAALPDISPATIRDALNALRDEGRLASGRGRNAAWTRLD